ncbi:winged helix DNA-binding domain-containing protein [Singulisphaera sp. GP187]|uniref:winged helix DNA-binding domain-containing protein n=1 Tax=Singulisphaera sp. GP187 TaxID=1882752 RepID=UPI00094136DC|nr:winged helix DNA-binding domain-containing protein [Singulisphaera sp. GP187]
MKPETLSRTALNRALLARQMMLAREAVAPLVAVERLVGLQAQQPQPPFIGLWTRIAGFERESLWRLLHDRAVVRSTLMRGTLHLMSAADYLRIRGTLQPMLSAGMRAVLRDRLEGLDVEGLTTAARAVFHERPRTFTELRTALLETVPEADERAMGFAVRTHLPLVAVPDDSSWGYRADPDFATAESWLGTVPGPGVPAQELVLRYLAGFGPAAAVDVQAWSGLTGVRDQLEALRPRLKTFRDDRKRELFDLPEAPRPPEETPAPVRFLPGFDNIILSHADRTRIIADEYRPRVTTKNLLVLPTFLVDGFVAGTWKVMIAKKAACLTLSPFTALAKPAKAELAEEGEQLVRFIEPDAVGWSVKFAAA